MTLLSFCDPTVRVFPPRVIILICRSPVLPIINHYIKTKTPRDNMMDVFRSSVSRESNIHPKYPTYPRQRRKMNGPRVTTGILPLIDKISIPNAIFCRGLSSATLAHYEQQDEWSCGYRNLQMLLSSILPNIPTYHPLFEAEGNNQVPSLVDIQQIFEMSWKDGFDREGAKYYGNKIRGTDAEIGAVEVASLLSFLSIDSVVVQFDKSRRLSWDLVEKFAWHYFSSTTKCQFDTYADSCESASETVSHVLRSVRENGHDCTVDKSLSFSDHSDTGSWSSLGSRCECFRPPLYLQWDGHSATIVGVEKTVVKSRIRYNLLVFDPANEVVSLKAGLKIAMKFKQFNSNIIEPLRMPMHKIKGDRCQIIVCSTRPLSLRERHNSKLSVNAVTAIND